MTPFLLPYSTALLLGSLHALEADHMAAVTSFAVRRPSLREAVHFGVRWAIGHGGAIVIIGAGLLLLGARMPAATEHLLERFVGVVMIGLGIWTFRGAAGLHAHAPVRGDEPRPVPSPVPHHEHHAGAVPAPAVHTHGGHRHTVTAVGVVHGLAGSGAAVALIPVVAMESPLAGILYLVVFAVGTILAMGVYGLFAGAIVGRTSRSSIRMARLIARITGVATVCIGIIWLVR
jgi:nickel/cobalt transporter (NicO) family protein